MNTNPMTWEQAFKLAQAEALESGDRYMVYGVYDFKTDVISYDYVRRVDLPNPISFTDAFAESIAMNRGTR